MSINENEREIALWWYKGYLPPKEGPYTMQDYLEAKRIAEKVQENDAINIIETIKNLSIFYSSIIKILSKPNNNSVETSLNMKGENGTVNFNKKEFNNGSIIEEKSIFRKPESIEERRDISKELKKDGYTQQERADRMGYSQSTISRDDKVNKNKRKN